MDTLLLIFTVVLSITTNVAALYVIAISTVDVSHRPIHNTILYIITAFLIIII